MTTLASTWRDWLPFAIRPGSEGWNVEWCYFGGVRPTAPFFSQTVAQVLADPARFLFRRRTSLDFLRSLADAAPGIRPTGFIFHLSRCGSTLVSQMLAALPRHLVLSEPPVLDEFFQFAAESAALRGLVNALGQPRLGEDRFFIKLDCWQVCNLPQILAVFPDTPWIFLYRDPVEVLVSQRRAPGLHVVPGMIDPRRLGLDPATVDPGAPAEHAARVLAQLCRAVLAHGTQGRGMLVNYRELPEAVLGSISRHFRLELTDEDRSKMAGAARFDTKNPGQAFVSDSATKQRQAPADLRELADRWLAEPFAQLESLRKQQVSPGD